MAETKARNFAFILYPESLPEDWIAQLTTLGVPMAISPLHDMDKSERKSKEAVRKEAERRAKNQCKNIENAFDREVKLAEAKQYWLNVVIHEQANLPEFKKAHYHVLYVNPNPVTADSVLRKLRRKLGNEAVGHVEIVDNVENYYGYLTHESADAVAKNKHVYDKKDIKHLNAFDIDRYITLDKEQKTELFVQLIKLIDSENIINMKQLMGYIREHGSEIGIHGLKELIDITSGNAWFLKMVFDGNYQTLHRGRLTPEDEE